MTHVRTSPYYPQSNGKIERWHGSLKRECIRPKTPLSLDQARRIVAGYVEHYNTRRLHSAIGYVTPKNKLEGREKAIFAERDRKLAQARERRRAKRLERYGKEGSNDIFLLTEKQAMTSMTSTGETEAGSAGLRRAQSS